MQLQEYALQKLIIIVYVWKHSWIYSIYTLRVEHIPAVSSSFIFQYIFPQDS